MDLSGCVKSMEVSMELSGCAECMEASTELSGFADSMEASMDFSGCAASMEALAWMSSVNRSKTCQSKSLVGCEEKSAVVSGGMAKVLLNSPHFLSLTVATVWDSPKFRIYGKIYGCIHRFEWLCKIYGDIHGFQ
jgi:hypothetical protein